MSRYNYNFIDIYFNIIILSIGQFIVSWLVTTTSSCVITKTMGKIEGTFQGVLALSFIFLLVASFVCLALIKYNTDDWTQEYVIIACAAELILFVWEFIFIGRGSRRIHNETHDYEGVKDFYHRILLLMGFGMAFSLIMILFHYRIFSPKEIQFDPILIYGLNIFIPALLIFVWMCIKIYTIKKTMRRL